MVPPLAGPRTLTVVIPAYNEAATIRATVERTGNPREDFADRIALVEDRDHDGDLHWRRDISETEAIEKPARRGCGWKESRGCDF